MAQPDLCAFYEELGSGYGWDYGALAVDLAPIGLVTGTNPPYTATDFLGFYPDFGGTPLQVQGTLTAGSPTVTGVTGSGFGPGQLIAGSPTYGSNLTISGWSNIPAGTIITTVNGTTLTLSQNATGSDQQPLTIYPAPLLPLPVLAAYVALANASLVQARWLDLWLIGMADFIAHFCTLWMRTSFGAGATSAQVAAAGLARGIITSAGAGPVSKGVQPIQIDGWNGWNETEYGVRFATNAKVIGMGPMLLW